MRHFLRLILAAMFLLVGTADQSFSRPGKIFFPVGGPSKPSKPSGLPEDDFQSHFPLDVKQPDDLDGALKERLSRGREIGQAKDLLKKLMENSGSLSKLNIPPEDLLKLQKNLSLQNLPTLLKLNDQLEQYLHGSRFGSIKHTKQLEDLLLKLKSNPNAMQSIQEIAQKYTNPHRPTVQSINPVLNPAGGGEDKKTLSNRMEDFLANKLTSAATWLEKNGYDRDGSALKAALEQFSSVSSNSTGTSLDNFRAIVNGLEKVTGQISPEKLGFANIHKLLPKMNLKMPTIPSIPTTPPVPSWGGFGSGPNFSSDSATPIFLWIVLAVLGCLLAWKLPSWIRDERESTGQRKKRLLSSWPVPPGQIRTRAELIGAFEHLSEVSLGPIARTCNHAELAERLGGDATDRQEAARCLASLYEQSRYMPEQAASGEPLKNAEQMAARQALCLLAGVAAP